MTRHLPICLLLCLTGCTPPWGNTSPRPAQPIAMDTPALPAINPSQIDSSLIVGKSQPMAIDSPPIPSGVENQVAIPLVQTESSQPLMVQQPVATIKTFQWECDTNTGATYYTGLERTDSLINPNWVVVCGFIAQSVNTVSITSYTSEAYFRAWNDSVNRF